MTEERGEERGKKKGRKSDRRKQFETVAAANREETMDERKGNCIQPELHRRRVAGLGRPGCTGGSGTQNNIHLKRGTRRLREQREGIAFLS